MRIYVQSKIKTPDHHNHRNQYVVLVFHNFIDHSMCLALLLEGKLYNRLRIWEENRDLNHSVCNCINVLLSKQTNKSNVFRNLHVIKDLMKLSLHS